MKRLLFLFTFLSVIIVFSNSANAAPSVVTSGLKTYWHYKTGFYNTTWRNFAPDTIPNFNGSINGASLVGDGIFFSGSNQNVLFPSLNIYDSSFSVDFWFHYPSTSIGYITIAGSSTSSRIQLYVNNKNFLYRLGAEDTLFTNNNEYVSDVYQHGTFVYDKTTNAEKIYVNGVLKFSRTSASIHSWNQPFATGMGYNLGDDAHKLSTLRFYDRALSESEIQQNFLLGAHDIGMSIPSRTIPDTFNFRSPTQSNTTISLRWDRSGEADDYIIKRDGVQIAQTTSDSFSDTSLTRNTEYTYELVAKNSLGHESLPIILKVKTLDLNLVEIIEDFEDTDYQFTLNGNWIRSSLYSSSGVYSYKSGAITHNQSSKLQIPFTIPAGATNAKVSFSYKVDSENGYDKLSVKHNGSTILSNISGNTSNIYEQSVSEGSHMLEFTYSKDGSASVGLDASFIDDFSVVYEEPIVTRDWNLLSPSSSIDFGTVVIDGSVQRIQSDLGAMPVEHIGTNTDGWNITASATPFTQIGGSGLSLPINSLKLKGIQQIVQTAGSSDLPVVNGSDWVIDSSPIEIMTAATNTGEGGFDVIFPSGALELTLDTSSVLVDPQENPTRYRSTLTWSMSVGP